MPDYLDETPNYLDETPRGHDRNRRNPGEAWQRVRRVKGNRC